MADRTPPASHQGRFEPDTALRKQRSKKYRHALIELSEEHAAELEEVLAPYREHARQVGGSGRAGRGPRPPRQPRQDTQAIRQWAWDHGYQVSDRGRIPINVITAYQAAHGQAR